MVISNSICGRSLTCQDNQKQMISQNSTCCLLYGCFSASTYSETTSIKGSTPRFGNLDCEGRTWPSPDGKGELKVLGPGPLSLESMT